MYIIYYIFELILKLNGCVSIILAAFIKKAGQ